jgi:intein-encoded DNA endonuclease-like protein
MNYSSLRIEQIANKLGRTLTSVYNQARKLGLRKYPRPWVPQPTFELGYVLGVLLGDGYVDSEKVALNCRDKEFAEAFRNALEKIGLSPTIRFGSMWNVWACSTEFTKWVKQCNVIEFVERNNLESAFLRGFYDSEGSLEDSNEEYGHKAVVFYNTNIYLLKDIKRLLDRLGIHAVISRNHKKGRASKLPSGKIIVSKKDSYKLGIFRQSDVRAFLTKIGSSIPRKSGVEWLNA